MRAKLIVWMLILLLMGYGAIWASFTLKPTKKVDCNRAVELFSHYLGKGTIAQEEGRDITADKQDMLGVIRNYPSCFPQSLVSYAG